MKMNKSQAIQLGASLVLVALVLVLVLLFSGCSRTDAEAANQSALQFTQHIEGQTGVVCAESDSDRDGYVSCTVFRGKDEPLQIQCGSEKWCVWNCARGCKYQPTVKVRGR